MNAGEIWQVDLGLAGKVRPCLLLTGYPDDNELALITLIPHTTALRGNQWEVDIAKPFLKPGAFHLQQIQSVPSTRLMRRMGALQPAEMKVIQNCLRERFNL
ncbi:MAG: type II toxin-antitoxin system PemK/MazF family toxin [Verrucomicrobiales bacterium]|nr:type II toxin-antitoxin system PemK/MazF family toxin [Verrucomicrobiales bacterium]